jgi:hypothetical protein
MPAASHGSPTFLGLPRLEECLAASYFEAAGAEPFADFDDAAPAIGGFARVADERVAAASGAWVTVAASAACDARAFLSVLLARSTFSVAYRMPPIGRIICSWASLLPGFGGSLAGWSIIGHLGTESLGQKSGTEVGLGQNGGKVKCR